MSANATAGAMLSEVAEDPDKPTSLSAVTADHSAAAQATVKMVDDSDKATLIALTQKPYFERAKSLVPEMRKLEQDMVNEPAPEFEKEVEEIISRTLARYQVAKGK